MPRLLVLLTLCLLAGCGSGGSDRKPRPPAVTLPPAVSPPQVIHYLHADALRQQGSAALAAAGITHLLVPLPDDQRLFRGPVTEAELTALLRPVKDAAGGLPLWLGTTTTNKQYDARTGATNPRTLFAWEADPAWDAWFENLHLLARVCAALGIQGIMLDLELYPDYRRGWPKGPPALVAQRARETAAALRSGAPALTLGAHTMHYQFRKLPSYPVFARALLADGGLLLNGWGAPGPGTRAEMVQFYGCDVVPGWFPRGTPVESLETLAAPYRRAVREQGRVWVFTNTAPLTGRADWVAAVKGLHP